jgi:hypothetical protein
LVVSGAVSASGHGAAVGDRFRALAVATMKTHKIKAPAERLGL